MQADGASAGPVPPVPAQADRRVGGFSPGSRRLSCETGHHRLGQIHLEVRLHISETPREELGKLQRHRDAGSALEMLARFACGLLTLTRQHRPSAVTVYASGINRSFLLHVGLQAGVLSLPLMAHSCRL